MAEHRFAMLDANNDGVVTREEFERAQEDRAERRGPRGEHRFDSAPPPPGGDPDGGPPPPMRGGHGRGMGLGLNGPRWFAMADANGDGKVTREEADKAAAALFDRFDTDRDGTISPDELRAAMMTIHRARGDEAPPPPPEN